MPLNNFKRRVPEFPENQIIHSDFFNLNDTFDLIIEQTFFCAIHPDLRADYVVKMNQLLTSKGKLVGVMFNVPLNNDKPPFGGDKASYMRSFKPYFKIEIFESCYNSYGNRKGRELFIKLTKL